MEENKAYTYESIWSFKDEVIDKNTEAKKKEYNIPDEDVVATNVSGFIINSVGNIVAKFGFFVEVEDDERVDFKISPDGFMAAVYNRPTNIIVGYGHPLRFHGLVDPKESQILHLGPDAAAGQDIIISIANDEKMKEQGIVCIMRDCDVMTDILVEDVREDFIQSLEDAKQEVTDLNEIERAFNSYLRHIYVVLGEDFTKKDETPIEEEETYD